MRRSIRSASPSSRRSRRDRRVRSCASTSAGVRPSCATRHLPASAAHDAARIQLMNVIDKPRPYASVLRESVEDDHVREQKPRPSAWQHERMLIREAVDADWPAIFPIFDAIVSEGKTYAYPESLSSEEAKAMWMLAPPGRTVVALDDGDDNDAITGTATMGPNRPGRGSHIATASFMVN